MHGPRRRHLPSLWPRLNYSFRTRAACWKARESKILKRVVIYARWLALDKFESGGVWDCGCDFSFFSLRSVNYIGWNELIELCRSVDSSRNNRQSCLLYLSCYESADRKIFIIYRTKNYDVWIFHFGLSWNSKRRKKEYIYIKKKEKSVRIVGNTKSVFWPVLDLTSAHARPLQIVWSRSWHKPQSAVA